MRALHPAGGRSAHDCTDGGKQSDNASASSGDTPNGGNADARSPSLDNTPPPARRQEESASHNGNGCVGRRMGGVLLKRRLHIKTPVNSNAAQPLFEVTEA